MINELIEKKIKELPNNIQKAIKKFDWKKQIMHIAHNNKMQYDDVEYLEEEIMLVVVGITNASDFENKLTNRLNIPHSFAEKLVADSNEYIFYPLQKLAFEKNENENEIILENEIIPEEKVVDIMNDHGIELIDEKIEQREYPKNELQDIADSLFKKVNNNKKIKEKEKIPEKKEIKKESLPLYNEPITEKDLVGIRNHKIDTSILNEKDDLQRIKLVNNIPIEKKHKLDLNNLNKIILSKKEQIDVSPSKEEQISERGEFLKHIGAN